MEAFFRDKLKTYVVWRTAKNLGIRPSELVEIHDPYVRFEFDYAVSALGTHADNKLQELDKEGKPKYTVYQALGLAPPKSTNLKRGHAQRVTLFRRNKKGKHVKPSNS